MNEHNLNEHNLSYVKDYHRRLIDNTHIEQQIKASRPAHPNWLDHVLLRLGNSMIAMGQRMKESSAIVQTADLTQECA